MNRNGTAPAIRPGRGQGIRRRRAAVGTVVLSIALMILAIAVLVGAHMIYYSLVTYPVATAHGRLSATINASEAVIPITIINPTSEATPVPFQLQLNFSPAAYSSLEAPDLSNIRFYGGGQELYAWLQSYSSSPPNTAQLATAWVKLPFSIGPQGSATIYMTFNGSGWSDHWGEAPTLSTPYGAHDNGRYVFLTYGAFGSGFDGWAPGVFAGTFLPTPSGGGILMVNNQGGEGTYLIAPNQLPQIPLVVDVEWGFSAPGGKTPADALAISIGNAVQQILVALVGNTAGGGTPAASGSIFAQNEFYPRWPVLALKDAVANKIVGTISWRTGQVELVYSAFTLIPPKGNGGKWGAMAGYAIVGSSLPSSPPPVQPPQVVNLLDAGTSNNGAPIPFAVSAPQGMNLEIGAGSGGATAYTYVYWVLARAYPPDDVMPSSTLGAPMVPMNVTNYGPVEVKISQIVVVSNGVPTYYPYSAVLFPGQSVTIYMPLSGSIGLETDSGVVWVRPVK
ncbi:MAG: hypothetical protein ACP5LG_07020 [Conexivisphaera sp.]